MKVDKEFKDYIKSRIGKIDEYEPISHDPTQAHEQGVIQGSCQVYIDILEKIEKECEVIGQDSKYSYYLKTLPTTEGWFIARYGEEVGKWLFSKRDDLFLEAFTKSSVLTSFRVAETGNVSELEEYNGVILREGFEVTEIFLIHPASKRKFKMGISYGKK